MPVLIIEGSGKAADFISKGYKLSENKTSDESSIFTETFTSEMLPLAKRITTDTNVDPIKLVEQLKECLQKRKMINVFSLDDTNETLDRMIQNIIFKIRNKDNKMGTEKKIKLVNRWNRPDIAEKEIFNMEKRQDIEKIRDSLKNKDSAVSNLFRKSLVDNRKDFVTLVLKYILETKCYQQFVTENLSLLYSECMDPGGSCRAGQLLEEYIQSSKQRIWKRGDNKINTSDSENLDIINKAVMHLLGNNKLKAIAKEEHRPFTSKDPFKELFMWAVLMNRKEMAKLFWKKDRDFICAALYASSLAKKLEKTASSEGYMELTKYFADDSRYYEQLAYDVMTELYIKDKHKARQLLVQKVQRYGNTTLFELSQHNHLMKFVEHTACQTKLNIIWKGNILPYTSHAKVIVAAFVPFMIQSIMIQDRKGEYTPQIANNRYISHEQRDFPNVKSVWSSKFGIESTKMQNQTGLAEQWNEIEFHQRIKNIYYFYNSPVTKFIFSLLAYIAFLVVFSLFVLTDLHPVSEGGISYKEYIIFGWATSMMTEELRQAFVLNTALLKYITWFKFWTIFEVFMYSLFYTSVLLRLTLSGDDFFYARAMYAITLGTFILNSMQFFIVSTAIGPKVIMIGRLIFDIIFFVLIFAVFVFGFGIIYHAIMYPNSEPGYLLFKEIIYIPYWQLYGELFLDTFQGTETDCTKDPELYKNGTMTRCPEVSEINYMLLAVYTVLTHIILVNFLIAMFSHTFTRSQDNNELVWKFHRFSLVQEYYDRCLLIPPLIILSHMKRAFFFILDKCCHVSNTKQVNVFRIDMKLKEKKRIDLLEKDAVNSYSNASVSLRKYRARAISSDDGSYSHDAEHSLHDQVEKVTKEVGKLQNFLEEMKQDIKDIKSYKQRVLLVELPKGIPSGTHVPEEVPMFQQTS
ncbi:transient receptor potential cation channel subfamily M member-like 2 [Mytilus edulis]